MTTFELGELKLAASADFHVHLRDGELMETVVPTIRQGGVNIVYVMVRFYRRFMSDTLIIYVQPNLQPPILTPEHAIEYRSKLEAIEPRVLYLMSLYLSSSTTPEIVRRAKDMGISGVKCYPAGVTTNSSAGITDYNAFFPVFREMEKLDLVLNLHGECQSGNGIDELNAEESFLPTLLQLHSEFPKLRIVLEHCTTAAAIQAVQSCGPTVAGTITAHHLFLTKSDWPDDPFSFCKPVAKLESDRVQLIRAAASGIPKFFYGTDSAPHSAAAKRKGAAGIFTQPYATQLIINAFERAVEAGILKASDVHADMLANFLGNFGRAFYKVAAKSREEIQLRPEPVKISHHFGDSSREESKVVPFRKGEDARVLKWITETN
ncbi:MAG: hypothetical protein M1814_002633 [Vezdaea aestivalis]|nr:MAG: hypothetical protein M1814_002633 [Vezdaea aestivalis]